MVKLLFLILFLTLFLVSTTTIIAVPRSHANGDPENWLQECLGECNPSQQEGCIERCRQEYEEQKGGGGGEGSSQSKNQQEEGREEAGKETENNPYVFKEENFTLRFRTDEGSYRILNRFARKSDLLIGIDYYALGLFEANPNAFKLLHHSDAEAIYVVIRGKGIIGLLRENEKESYNLRQGDILRVTSGTTLFIANTDSNVKLFIVKLLIPTSIPGEVQEFFSGGGEDPKSVYRSFSKDLIQAALKISEGQLEKLTLKQNKGAVVRASREQIREIERHAFKGPRLWPFGQSRGPFNLLDRGPTHSNKYGVLYEAGEKDYGELRDPDVLVSYVNIAKDAMRLPFHNSKSATLAFVVKGKGYFEMVCPHLSRQCQRQGQEEGSHRQGEEGQEEGSRGQGEEGQEEGSRGQGEEGQEEGSRGQGEEGEEEGSRGQGQGGQKEGKEEGSRGQGQGGQEGKEEGSRGQGQGGQEGKEERSRGQGQGGQEGQEEGSRGQGQGGQEGQEEGSRGQGQAGQEEGQEEGSRGQGEEGQEEGSRGQGQGGQEEGQEEGSRGQGEEGQEEGSRGQGVEGQEEGSRGQGEEGQEEGSRGQGEGGQEREEQGNRGRGQGEVREACIQYERVRASLSPNTVHYVPPAHPFITVASSDESLQIIYFELFAHGNQRSYLAGSNNFLRSMGRVEAELSYNTSAEEMQDIVLAQDDIGFSKGPQQGRDGGGSHMGLASIMDFMGF